MQLYCCAESLSISCHLLGVEPCAYASCSTVIWAQHPHLLTVQPVSWLYWYWRLFYFSLSTRFPYLDCAWSLIFFLLARRCSASWHTQSTCGGSCLEWLLYGFPASCNQHLAASGWTWSTNPRGSSKSTLVHECPPWRVASSVPHCILGPLCRASVDSHIRLATVHRVALVDLSDLLISSWYVVNSVVRFIDCNKFLLCCFCHIIFALTDSLFVILSEHILRRYLLLK